MARQRGDRNGGLGEDEEVPDPSNLEMGLDEPEEEMLAGSSFRSGLDPSNSSPRSTTSGSAETSRWPPSWTRKT